MSETPEMVRRVAQAIVKARQFGCDEARAAITAMREPTDAMHKAGSDVLMWDNSPIGPLHSVAIWRAMIDAAPLEDPNA